MRNKQWLGLIVAGAGIIDVVIAAVILDSLPRTIVLASGIATVAVGLALFVAGLRSAGR
jgi:protein-S-isoprenylcysteine O-methyltransferase Ste14